MAAQREEASGGGLGWVGEAEERDGGVPYTTGDTQGPGREVAQQDGRCRDAQHTGNGRTDKSSQALTPPANEGTCDTSITIIRA